MKCVFPTVEGLVGFSSCSVINTYTSLFLDFELDSCELVYIVTTILLVCQSLCKHMQCKLVCITCCLFVKVICMLPIAPTYSIHYAAKPGMDVQSWSGELCLRVTKKPKNSKIP